VTDKWFAEELGAVVTNGFPQPDMNTAIAANEIKFVRMTLSSFLVFAPPVQRQPKSLYEELSKQELDQRQKGR
jgi:hypothetical protein